MPRLVPLAAMLLLLAACGRAAGGDGPGPDDTAAAAGAAAGPAAAPTPPGDARPARLLAVLDGDSLEMDLDGAVEEVRLAGVNTPERAECWSDAARDAASRLVEGALLLVAPTGRDRYGRLIGFVWADGDLVNLRLLEAGAALAVTLDHRYAREFLAAEESAFSTGAGMWAPDACGPPTAASVAVAGAEPDPPGPDDDPDGEWVEIANRGGPVDLTGWVLRDESSTHRFTFPKGFTLGAGDRVTVRSGGGSDGGGTLYWDEGSVWNNGGDTVLLLDEHGNVVDRYRY